MNARNTISVIIVIAMLAMFGASPSLVSATDYPFYDDMENPELGNWTLEGTWGYTEDFAYSPTHSLTDSPGGAYGDNLDISATLSSALNLFNAIKPVLSFRQKYALETDADYGYVEVSRDEGINWTKLAFVTGNQPDWGQVKIDLSEYAGIGNLMIRFRLTSNASVAYDGWYIDDVEVKEADAVISYPFFDDMEGGTDKWLPSSWKLVMPGVAGSEFCWEGTGLPYYAIWNTLTLANTLDLTSAEHPQLTFWHKYEDAHNHFYVQVSDSYGHEGTWQTLVTYSGDQGTWQQVRIDLSAFQGLPNVRIRFVCNAYRAGDWWQIDDVRVEDTPWPHGSVYVTDATMHGAHVSWEQYPWSIGLLFADFDRYEIYRATSEDISRENGELACQIVDPAVTEYDDTYTILQPQHYWYRMYVVDVNGMYSAGSIPVQAIYQIPTVGYPFEDDMEGGTDNWEWGSPWGLTDLHSRSTTHSWTDSPDGSYANNADTALTTQLNLWTAVKPFISFWHKYALETDADYGYVEVSRDEGINWTKLAFVTGNQPDWGQVKIDLSEYAGIGNLMIRFRLTSNASVAYDGWYIDDVEVKEADAVISYPFFDDMEGGTDKWLPSSWKLVMPGVAGSEFCWEGTGLPYYAIWNTLTLANTLDLTSAEHPQLTFWHKYEDAHNHFYVQVSDSYGHEGTWQTLVTYSGDQGTWVKVTIPLDAYQGLPNVRIRFVCNAYRTGDWWQIDDVSVRGEELPCPVPDIKANGHDGPLFIIPGDNVNITAALNPGNQEGETYDWWIGVFTPFGNYWCLGPDNWIPSDNAVSIGQIPLFNVPETSLIDRVLPNGFYTFFFILDGNPNGKLDVLTWLDYVVVCVTPDSESVIDREMPDFEAIFKEKMNDLMSQ